MTESIIWDGQSILRNGHTKENDKWWASLLFGHECYGYLKQGLSSRLVEEANDLASNVLPPGLLVVHDTGRGGEDDVAELTRGKELDNPLLEVAELDVVAGRDDTSLVQAAVQLDDNLAVPVVVDLLKFSNVAWKRC